MVSDIGPQGPKERGTHEVSPAPDNYTVWRKLPGCRWDREPGRAQGLSTGDIADGPGKPRQLQFAGQSARKRRAAQRQKAMEVSRVSSLSFQLGRNFPGPGKEPPGRKKKKKAKGRLLKLQSVRNSPCCHQPG